MDQVFIVMKEEGYEGGWHWNVDRVFATKESAIQYIHHKKNNGYRELEFDIVVEEVYAT